MAQEPLTPFGNALAGALGGQSSIIERTQDELFLPPHPRSQHGILTRISSFVISNIIQESSQMQSSIH